jgi:hypothetical protein
LARWSASRIFVAFFSPKRARLVVRAEIQFAEHFQFQVEQVERFLDEAAFDEFFRHDAAERFEVERLALREILDAPRELRRTARDVLAAPGDFFFIFGRDALLRVQFFNWGLGSSPYRF